MRAEYLLLNAPLPVSSELLSSKPVAWFIFKLFKGEACIKPCQWNLSFLREPSPEDERKE